MTSDTFGCGMRFIRTFCGGPLLSTSSWMVHEEVTSIKVTDGDRHLGHYTLRDGAWHWQENEHAK